MYVAHGGVMLWLVDSKYPIIINYCYYHQKGGGSDKYSEI